VIQADEEQVDNAPAQSYGDKVGEKALSGFTNINTAFLEIPKNIINTTNESNVAFGVIGGGVKGILNTVGRLLSGVADLVTAPLPTHPIAQPDQIWQDFDVDTTYGKAFRLDNEPKTVERNTANETSIKTESVEECPEKCPENSEFTNRKRDRIFKDKMTK
jgi:putative exosortase-associated protein (TIGR04073 family)